jgi:asparagine N-glycosylation enzyme membrane subunit Stt3
MVKPLYEWIFASAFSVLSLALIYFLISSNGVILGNDPAVHLSKAYEMLETGKVSVSEITGYPPLYRVVLAGLIVFTGANSIEHAIFLMKVLTVTIDWLLIFSVYLLGRRLLNPTTGVIASFLLLLCFPLYEINFWGGFPSLLSIVYMCLLIFYLSRKDIRANTLVIFLMAFSIVLTHQFATFLAIILLMIYAAIALFIFRGSTRRLLVIGL